MNDKDIREIFEPEGLLAQELPAYEFRPDQMEMALAVGHTLEGGILAAEAETGIGKTIAYLIPAVLSGQKIIISTATINLQEQILSREIPFIKKYVDPDLSVLCVKGRQNYLCIYRFHQLLASSQQHMFYEKKYLDDIARWAKETHSGDRAEISWLQDNSSLWHEISSSTSQCLGSQCPEESMCFINRLRKKAAASRLLVVNHHLFFSDLALRRFGFGEVLPRYESVIFDEAHHLESIGTRYFGITFSHYQLLDLVSDIEKSAQLELKEKDRVKVSQLTGSLLNQADHFAKLFPGQKGKFPLDDFISKEPRWHEELSVLSHEILRLCDRLDSLAVLNDVWSALERRGQELHDKLQSITSPAHNENDSYVRWFERREKTVTLSASPIEISSVLEETLYSKVNSSIFTSATLTVGGCFAYLKDRLGLPLDTETLKLPSPFDYKNRTLLYIPNNRQNNSFPEPSQPAFLESAQQRILDILKHSKGRALVLFTSIKAMKSTYEFLTGHLPFTILVQGEAPKNVLLETFQDQTDSVLLAVASFWEGVDVPGESLSCVIIDKLPFEVPSDPVIMARINKIRQEGGNPFMDFQTPRAILSLRQGIGRLMRASTDKGLLAILDIRLFTKRYGRLFLDSLPPSPITRNLEELAAFFHKKSD